MIPAVRARALLEEARALGVSLGDLIAAADTATAVPTVEQFLVTVTTATRLTSSLS